MNSRLKQTLFVTLLSSAIINYGYATENGDSWLERSKKAAEKALDKSTEMVDKFIKKEDKENAKNGEGQSSEKGDSEENGTTEKKNSLFGEVWSKITPELDKALNLQDEQDTLPSSSWFGKDKGDVREELNAILDEAIEILGISNATNVRQDIQAIERKIHESKENIADYRQKKIGAPVKSKWKTTVSDYEEKIGQTQELIQQYAIDIEKLKLKFSRALSEIGVNLSAEQVDLLLSSVVGDDIIQGSIVYANVKEISQQLMKLTVDSNEDFNISKRYYGLYTILLKILLHMQNTFIHRIDENYVPKIEDIVDEVDVVRGNTKRLLKETKKESHRKHLLANLEAQDLTVKTAALYKRHLLGQREKVEIANRKTIADFEVARNTYKTVKVSGELVNLLRSSQKAFETLMNIQTPDLLVFENLQMKQEFASLTKKLAD